VLLEDWDKMGDDMSNWDKLCEEFKDGGGGGPSALVGTDLPKWDEALRNFLPAATQLQQFNFATDCTGVDAPGFALEVKLQRRLCRDYRVGGGEWLP